MTPSTDDDYDGDGNTSSFEQNDTTEHRATAVEKCFSVRIVDRKWLLITYHHTRIQ